MDQELKEKLKKELENRIDSLTTRGQVLRCIRDVLGLTQRELAKELDLSAVSVKRYENDKNYVEKLELKVYKSYGIDLHLREE